MTTPTHNANTSAGRRRRSSSPLDAKIASGLCSLSRPAPRTCTGATSTSLTDALSVPVTPQIGIIAKATNGFLEMIDLGGELRHHVEHFAVRRFTALQLTLTSGLFDERRRDHRGHDRQE